MTLHSNPRRFAMEKKNTQQTYHYKIFTKTHFHKDITKENNKMQFNNWKCFEISSFFFVTKDDIYIFSVLGLWLWCLTIFQRKSKDPKKTTDLSQVTDKFYHILLYTSPWSRFKFTTSVVIGTDCIGNCKSNYHVIMTTTSPVFKIKIHKGVCIIIKIPNRIGDVIVSMLISITVDLGLSPG
jgi:hypothetical protein